MVYTIYIQENWINKRYYFELKNRKFATDLFHIKGGKL